jgi:hypothetical protein
LRAAAARIMGKTEVLRLKRENDRLRRIVALIAQDDK